MHHRLKVLHNSITIKLELVEKANSLLDKIQIEEKIFIQKNVSFDNNFYDVVLTFDNDPRIESLVLEVMTIGGFTPQAIGSFEHTKSKMIFSLLIN